jgi:hypothetical protein
MYRRRAMAAAGIRYLSIGRAELPPGESVLTDMAPLADEEAA